MSLAIAIAITITRVGHARHFGPLRDRVKLDLFCCGDIGAREEH